MKLRHTLLSFVLISTAFVAFSTLQAEEMQNKNINIAENVATEENTKVHDMDTDNHESSDYEESWICTRGVMGDTIFQDSYSSAEDCKKYCSGFASVCEATLQPKKEVQDDTDMAEFWEERTLEENTSTAK